MQMRKMWNKRLLWMGIFILFLGGFSGILLNMKSSMNMNLYNLEILSFDDGWSYEKGDKTETLNLPITIPLEQEKEITIKNRIPDCNLSQITMAFLNNFLKIQVYVDGKEVFAKTDAQQNKMNQKATVQWVYITLPNDSQGKEICLTFSSPHPMYASNLPALTLGERGSLILSHILQSFPNTIMDYILIMLGLILLILAFYWQIRGRDGKAYLTWGLFTILFALWVQTMSSGMEILYLTQRQTLLLSLFSWLLLPISYIMFVKAYIFPQNKTFLLFLYAFLLNCSAVLVLHYSGLAEIIETVIITHILIVILLCYMYYCFISEIFIKKIRKISVNEIGFVTMTICIVLELVMMYAKMPKSQMGRFIRVGILIYTCCLGVGEIIRSEEKERNLLIHENKEKDVQLQMFLSQIHPHFIFNALGVIRILTRTNPEKAYCLIYDFSKCLRASIHSIEKSERITFAEEIKHVNAYTNIEEVRFASRVKAWYDIKADNFLIPALSVQPLVENAIRHGLRKGEKQGYIWIRSYEEKSAYIIEVEDNGVGFDIESYIKNPYCETKLIGIQNIRFRLKNYGGELKLISFTKDSLEGKGTKVILTIPKDENEDNISG